MQTKVCIFSSSFLVQRRIAQAQAEAAARQAEAAAAAEEEKKKAEVPGLLS